MVTNMQFTLKHLTLIHLLSMLCLHCLVYGYIDSKVVHKHVSEKVRNGSQRKFTLSRSVHLRKKSKVKDSRNGVRKDVFEMPLPIQIQHLKDYPVPVPVKEETTENVLHVHIHDSEFPVAFSLCQLWLRTSYCHLKMNSSLCSISSTMNKSREKARMGQFFPTKN